MIHIYKILKWLLFLTAAFALAFLIYGFIKINQPVSTQAGEKIFEIPSGMTTKAVAKKLEREKLVSSAFFFETYVYVKKQSGKIQAGSYVLSGRMSAREIAGKLVAGETVSNAVKITVIEGWNVSDISRLLESEAGINGDVFAALAVSDFADDFAFLKDAPPSVDLEGYLFPDTYFVERGSAPAAAAGKMLANFDRKFDDDLREAAARAGRSMRDVVIMASIVEREVGRNVIKGTKLPEEEVARLREERRIVAGVFYNRLGLGMALESDATIGYITGSRSSRATLEELAIESPYNTYRNRGLPPGPVSNPSRDALEAAVFPEETDYIYFLTSPDGRAHFAETFEGHQANRRNYLE